MKKTAYVQEAVRFPLSRLCRSLGLATLVFGGAAAAAALALVLWFALLLLDENSILETPRHLREQIDPVAWAALAALVASSVPLAVLYSAWAAAGRRDLYRAAGVGFKHNRPSDRQMRWFLNDAHPWESAITVVLVWACLGALACGSAAPAIYFGGRPEERLLGHLMLGAAVVSVAAAAVCVHGLRVLTALAAEGEAKREQRWPLPQSSDLRQSLRRSSGGDSTMEVLL